MVRYAYKIGNGRQSKDYKTIETAREAGLKAIYDKRPHGLRADIMKDAGNGYVFIGEIQITDKGTPYYKTYPRGKSRANAERRVPKVIWQVLLDDGSIGKYYVRDPDYKWFKNLNNARKYCQKIRTVQGQVNIYDDHNKIVGTMFNPSAFMVDKLPSKVIGVWRVQNTWNCRFVKPDGSLGSYTNDRMRQDLRPKSVLNDRTGKIEYRRR